MTEAGQRIAAEIRDKGAITFARFMELALYCPNIGYYEKEEDIIGRRGDYYTSVSVGPLFGELLAFQFAEWLQEYPCPDAAAGKSRASGIKDKNSPVLRIVEAGAHAGDLAKDILGWLRQYRSSLLQNLEYWVVEPSDRRRSHQQQNLREFSSMVHWVREIAEFTQEMDSEFCALGSESVRGIIFSNELLDAMPVHRLGWDAKARTWLVLCAPCSCRMPAYPFAARRGLHALPRALKVPA
jgi:SAM-dependent MidA family methyltransferase